MQDFTIDEAARRLGISPSAVRRRIQRGRIPATKDMTPTGFVYRVQLPSDGEPGPEDPGSGLRSPHPSENAQNQRLARLGGFRSILREELAGMTELTAAQQATIQAQAEEIGRLKAQLEHRQEPWWKRWFTP